MRRKSKKIAITVILIGLVLAGFLIGYILNNDFSAHEQEPFATSRLNILVVGYDSTINGPSRADTIMVVSLDLEQGGIGILSIPRDTRVEIPGHGMGKINASHAYGGVELVDQTLELLLDIPIDYYVETDFEGFSSIIDALGGITVNIEEPLHYVDEAGGVNIDLPAGRVDLDGDKALQYVRYRGKAYGDIGRVQRQQKFVRAVLDQALKPGTVVKLPAIYREMKQAVNTNIPLNDITPFVKLAASLDFSKMETAMLPGEPKYIDGVSYWLADKQEMKVVLNNLIRSKEYVQNSQYYISVYNGNGAPGSAGKMAEELEKYGFNIEEVGNASRFDHQTTKIRYFDSRDKSVVLNIQELIGGEIDYIQEDRQGLEVIVGKNFVD